MPKRRKKKQEPEDILTNLPLSTQKIIREWMQSPDTDPVVRQYFWQGTEAVRCLRCRQPSQALGTLSCYQYARQLPHLSEHAQTVWYGLCPACEDAIETPADWKRIGYQVELAVYSIKFRN